MNSRSDSLDQKVAYEAAREALTSEIAFHIAQRAGIKDKTDPAAIDHRDAARDLRKVRTGLDPHNLHEIELVSLLLHSQALGRRHRRA